MNLYALYLIHIFLSSEWLKWESHDMFHSTIFLLFLLTNPEKNTFLGCYLTLSIHCHSVQQESSMLQVRECGRDYVINQSLHTKTLIMANLKLAKPESKQNSSFQMVDDDDLFAILQNVDSNNTEKKFAISVFEEYFA